MPEEKIEKLKMIAQQFFSEKQRWPDLRIATRTAISSFRLHLPVKDIRFTDLINWRSYIAVVQFHIITFLMYNITTVTILYSAVRCYKEWNENEQKVYFISSLVISGLSGSSIDRQYFLLSTWWWTPSEKWVLSSRDLPSYSGKLCSVYWNDYSWWKKFWYKGKRKKGKLNEWNKTKQLK